MTIFLVDLCISYIAYRRAYIDDIENEKGRPMCYEAHHLFSIIVQFLAS